MIRIAPRTLRSKLALTTAALLVGASLSAPLPAFAQGVTAPAAPAVPAAPAAPLPETVVATVGDQTITEADLAFASEDLQQELQQVPPEERRAFLVTVLIDMKVMAAAARQQGMDGTDIFKRRQAYLEERALRRAFFSEKVAGAVTDASVRAAYDKFAAAFQPQEEIHARHILVATKEEADAVKVELEGGKPFEIVAMDKTTDPSGKQSGGDLGFFSRGMMVPEFEAAAFALEIGGVSEPVQSQFGWHVIKLEEKRQSSPPPFEQLAQQLGQQVMFEAFDREVGALKAGLAVNIPDPALAAAVKLQSGEAEAGAAAPTP